MMIGFDPKDIVTDKTVGKDDEEENLNNDL